MDDWHDISTAPKDGTMLRVRLDTGHETFAEYWEPPPVEIDPKQTGGGWAINLALTDLDNAAAFGSIAQWRHLTDEEKGELWRPSAKAPF